MGRGLVESWLSTEPADREAAENNLRAGLYKNGEPIIWAESLAQARLLAVQHHAISRACGLDYVLEDNERTAFLAASAVALTTSAFPSPGGIIPVGNFDPLQIAQQRAQQLWSNQIFHDAYRPSRFMGLLSHREPVSHRQEPPKPTNQRPEWEHAFPIPPGMPLVARVAVGYSEPDHGRPREHALRRSIRAHVAGPLTALSIGHDLLDMDSRIKGVSLYCHGGLFYETGCVLIERPTELQWNDSDDDFARHKWALHSETGPALAYRDGFSVYALDGVQVPRWLIDEPEKLNAQAIDAERNAEVRRIMMNRLTMEKYLEQSDGDLVDEDERFGKLWYKRVPGEWSHRAFVEVLNSTPEPDGSIKTYHLPVPPDMRTAHAAVAWTFGKTPEEYQPELET